MLESDKHELMLILNEYAVATDEVNTQIDALQSIVKKYDPTGMVVGEAPCTKDLIEINQSGLQRGQRGFHRAGICDYPVRI